MINFKASDFNSNYYLEQQKIKEHIKVEKEKMRNEKQKQKEIEKADKEKKKYLKNLICFKIKNENLSIQSLTEIANSIDDKINNL